MQRCHVDVFVHACKKHIASTRDKKSKTVRSLTRKISGGNVSHIAQLLHCIIHFED